MKSIRYCVIEASKRAGCSPLMLQSCLDKSDENHPGQALQSHAQNIPDYQAENLVRYFVTLLTNNAEFQNFCREFAASCGGNAKGN